MDEKYKNKYRIKSARLPNWDYGSNGMYFITICTQNQEHFFGDIVGGEMQLKEIGEMVETEWLKTFEMRKDMNLQIGEFVVMPNHFHAIIMIGDNEYNTQTKNKFGPQSKNLASIVRGFKSSVTMFARKNGNIDFAWQSRFYDHIIRNKKSFNNITNYIINNPKKWDEDKFNKKETI